MWETTLNPENNSLLKVNYSDVNGEGSSPSDADKDIFYTLMGEDVSKRKNFINLMPKCHKLRHLIMFFKEQINPNNLRITLETLINIRWIAVIGQFFTVSFVYYGLKFQFHILKL